MEMTGTMWHSSMQFVDKFHRFDAGDEDEDDKDKEQPKEKLLCQSF